MQGSALPQAALFKGRFGGIVNIVEDSNGEAVEPIPNKKSADRRSIIYDCAAMQGAALPQASLIKGRFGGIVYIVEDISPPPATIKKEEIRFGFPLW